MIRDAAGVTLTPPRPRHAIRTPDTTPEAAPGPAPSPVANPRMRIDAALNLVVIEFRDATGEVGLTIPSPQEMKAYRTRPAPDADAAPALDLRR